MRHRSLNRTPFNIWPGFVDAFAALVLVMLFAFMIFIVSQFSLSGGLKSRDKLLFELNEKVAALHHALGLSKTAQQMLEKRALELHVEKEDLEGRLGFSEKHLQKASTIQETQSAELQALKLALDALNAKLAALAEALGASEKQVAEKETQIGSLNLKLEALLAERVKELSAYRSEFFGNLKKILGNRDDIRVVGDRFIFQSEVLFELGSDAIGVEGRRKLQDLARAIREISAKIPKSTPWILRVDGHTDVLPINSPTFASNWELSVARALAVVKVLLEEGVEPQHLVAAGFGEFHPLDSQNLARNRRIELKLDQR